MNANFKQRDGHGKLRNGHGKVMGKKLQSLWEPLSKLFQENPSRALIIFLQVDNCEISTGPGTNASEMLVGPVTNLVYFQLN